MTNEQRASSEFEDISEQIVACLFHGTDAEIIKTSSTKDGGYDIVVECRDGHSWRRAFFECKLRGQNLNLRDIAANAIIAFNHGAAALVAVTNHSFTQQLGDEIEAFALHTVLNIKMIVGDELRRILETHQIDTSEAFRKCLTEKDVRRRKGGSLDFQTLRIRFDEDIFRQLFRQKTELSPTDPFFNQIFHGLPEQVLRHVKDGELVLLTGYSGLGKRRLTKAVLSCTGKQLIEIDACFHEARDPLILELLSKIWGLPEPALFAQMEEANIHEIARWTGAKPNCDEIKHDLAALLNEKTGDKHVSAQQNALFSEYIAELMALHQNDIGYSVLIENLQFASKEVYDFLIYLIKRISERGVGCVVLYHEAEYFIQNNTDLRPALQHVSAYQPLGLSALSPAEAAVYLRHVCPKLSQHAADGIVKRVGVRLYNLDYALHYLFQVKGILPNDHKGIAAVLSNLTPNDMPGLISLMLPFYQDAFPALFEAFFLFDGKVPLWICEILGVQGPQLDKLHSAGIFKCEQGVLTAHDELIRGWIRQAYTLHSPSIQLRAAALCPILEQKEEYAAERISLCHALGQFRQALELIERDLKRRTRDRQYTTLLRELSLAVDLAGKTYDDGLKLRYLSQLLELYVITKQIVTDEAAAYLEAFRRCLTQASHPVYFEYALTYFSLKREFKLGHYTPEYAPVAEGATLYQACIKGEAYDNTGDWLGKLCGCYALIIKSTQGNGPALQAFTEAVAQLPESFELRREYLSHLACMDLFAHPEQAFSHYQEILDLFQSSAPDSAELPFHEYGDLAMALLLAKKLDDALRQCREAIRISQSNGLLDEEGRDLNILGCIKLCQGNRKAAGLCFREATAIMCHAGCRHYAWRSELNDIQLRIAQGERGLSLENELAQLYAEFKQLLREKVKMLGGLTPEALRQTREYHALLVFGFCLTKRPLQGHPADCVPQEFSLSSHLERYRQDLSCYLSGSLDIAGSPYLHGPFIFSVG